MLSKLKKITVSVGCLILYFLISMGLGTVVSSTNVVIPMFVADVVSAFLFGFIYWFICGRHHKIAKEDAYHFSMLGILSIAFIFVANYFTSQMASTFVHNVAASNYLQVYSDLSDDALLYYLILALTFGPIAEEILFRGILYRYIREDFGKIFSVLFSGILFGLMHGTTEHLPIAIGLTFVCCIVFEFTGKLWYCILIHILSNMFSLIFVMTINIPAWVGTLLFAILLIVMTVMLLLTDRLYGVFRKDKNRQTVEEYFNEKKNHWGEDNNQANDVNTDDKLSDYRIE